jgi:hypothetical protein
MGTAVHLRGDGHSTDVKFQSRPFDGSDLGREVLISEGVLLGDEAACDMLFLDDGKSKSSNADIAAGT